MKTVNFLGQEWDVPEWAAYITREKDGFVWVWESKPFMGEHGEYDSVG